MKSLLSSKHILVGTITALLTGFAWTSMLIFTHSLSLNDFRAWIVPLIVIGAIVGSSVGLFGKRRGNTLPQVLSSTLFGMGLSPITIIPLMTMVVLPVGKLAEWIGLIEPSTMPRDVATVLAMIAMTMIWLVVASAIGIVCLSVINKKPKQTVVQPYAAE
jgi:ascorbate-specific PTS system EIIC-type component UlaA